MQSAGSVSLPNEGQSVGSLAYFGELCVRVLSGLTRM